MKITLIYTTLPNEKASNELQGRLVKSKLVACANEIPIKACYEWNNNLMLEGEFALLCKTLPSHTEEAKGLIEDHHPYEVPCIISSEVDVNDSYFNWVKSTLRSK